MAPVAGAGRGRLRGRRAPPGQQDRARKGPAAKYRWKTTAVVGVEPTGGLGTPGVNGQTILFWANNYYIRAAACIRPVWGPSTGAAGAPDDGHPHHPHLGQEGGKAKANKGPNLVKLSANQKNKILSAKLTNAFAVQVGDAIEKALKAAPGGRSPRPTNRATRRRSAGYQVLQPAFAVVATPTGRSSSRLASHKVRGLARHRASASSSGR